MRKDRKRKVNMLKKIRISPLNPEVHTGEAQGSSAFLTCDLSSLKIKKIKITQMIKPLNAFKPRE